MTHHWTIKEIPFNMVYGAYTMLQVDIYKPTLCREHFNEVGETHTKVVHTLMYTGVIFNNHYVKLIEFICVNKMK